MRCPSKRYYTRVAEGPSERLMWWSQWVDATLCSNPPCIENKGQIRSLVTGLIY
jgi:hypothetical protein